MSDLGILSRMLASAWLVHSPDEMQALLQTMSSQLKGMSLNDIEARMSSATDLEE